MRGYRVGTTARGRSLWGPTQISRGVAPTVRELISTVIGIVYFRRQCGSGSAKRVGFCHWAISSGFCSTERGA